MLLQKTKNVTISKTYVFFITSNQQNTMLTTEKNWRERKRVPLIWFFLKKMSEVSLPQV